jgi:hypothetical protein
MDQVLDHHGQVQPLTEAMVHALDRTLPESARSQAEEKKNQSESRELVKSGQ